MRKDMKNNTPNDYHTNIDKIITHNQINSDTKTAKNKVKSINK